MAKINPFVFLDVSINGEPSGRMVFELFADVVPNIAENFRALCTGEKGLESTTRKPLHLKGTLFHCIKKGFMAQGGDFSTGDGGGESIYSGKFDDDKFELHHDGPGILSLANGKDNGSQFYVTFNATPHLDGTHVVFGKLVHGHETLNAVECVDVREYTPVVPVMIVNCGEVDGQNTGGAVGENGNQEFYLDNKNPKYLISAALNCIKEARNCVSKLYGSPKRRKVSAIRDFPVGCGAGASKMSIEGHTDGNQESQLHCGSDGPNIDKERCTEAIASCTDKSLVDDKKHVGNDKLLTEVIDEVEAIVEGKEKLLKEGKENIEVVLKGDEKLLSENEDGEVKEKAEASIVVDNIRQQFPDALNCSEDRKVCSSILYGAPKRKKVSAIRDFPLGCGASTDKVVMKECTENIVSHRNKNLIGDELGASEKNPLVEDDGTTEGNKEAEGVVTISESRQAQEQGQEIDIGIQGNEAVVPICRKGNVGKERNNEVCKSLKDDQKNDLAIDSYVIIPSRVEDIDGPIDDGSISKFDMVKQNSGRTSFTRVASCGDSKNTHKIASASDSFAKKSKLKEKLVEAQATKKELSNVVRGNELDDYSMYHVNKKTAVKRNHGSKQLYIKASSQNESNAFEKGGRALAPPDGRPGKSLENRKRGHSEDPEAEGFNLLALSQQKEELNIETVGEKLIVLALMAAPYCPWRTGKGSGTSRQRGSLSVEKARRNQKTPKKRNSLSKMSDCREMVLAENHDDTLALEYFHEDEENEKGYSTSPRLRECSVTVPPLGPPNSNPFTRGNEEVTRNKVRRVLRLFQVLCRKILQEEESKVKEGSSKGRRIDLDAAAILKQKNLCVNVDKPILGAVPGVEIGDEFHFRTELSIVGLHRPYQGGIDATNIRNRYMALSIVAGGTEDEMEGSDVLIYSGSGGSPGSNGEPPVDQKLERGNLSLKNSMETKEPVRVIRGSKVLKADPRDGRPKPFSTYVYDGLYMVEKYWKEKVQQGYFAFKFQLRRLPGQPELPIKEVKKSGKPSTRPGVCIKDISDGKEKNPICLVNTVDDERPLPFKYVTKIRYPLSCVQAPPKGCDCTDGCSDSEKCACAVKNGGEIPYNYNGAIVQAKPLVYECGPSCRCPMTCHNRVSQHGIKIQLEVFKTKSMGWGVRSLSSISSGSFICEYVGEMLPDKEAEQRDNDEYLFDIGHNYEDLGVLEGLSTTIESAAVSNSVEDAGFTIDAAKFGNVGRFINHSCSPNLYAQNVLYDHDDSRMPHIMLFAAENIPPLQELTYHYNYTVDHVRDSEGNIKRKECYCGSHECTGRLY